jgi:DNA-binding response OmpR family regulator
VKLVRELFLQLVIDDDPDIGRMIKMLLEYKGYSVTVLDRTEQAADIIRNNDVNLVIMDMLLSGTNGIDVCTRLKKDSTIAHVPVIMISAHPDAKKICLEAGADDFLAKPFDMEDMLSAINQFISRK